MAGRGMKAGLIGVVLAGGQSTRMGRDKALLPYQASTLLAQQVARLVPLCVRVCVSGRYDGFDCIQDQLAGIGPLAGVHAAAKQFPESTLLFVPVDMPLIDAAHLKALINRHEARHYCAQPLPAFFPDAKQLLLHIERLVEDQSADYALQQLHRRLGSCAMPVWDETVFANLNNPADWQHFTAKPLV
jgi:molybdopterin-guanine dinucleotide biosynthesis protein A